MSTSCSIVSSLAPISPSLGARVLGTFGVSVGSDLNLHLRVRAKPPGGRDDLPNDERVADDHDNERDETDDAKVKPGPHLLHEESFLKRENVHRNYYWRLEHFEHNRIMDIAKSCVRAMDFEMKA